MAAAKVIIFSKQQRGYLQSILNIPPHLLEVIPNGVHRDVYSPGPSEFRKGRDEDFVVGYFGRLAPEKNVGKLCEAFLDIADGRSCLVIMGKGMSERRLVRKYGKHPHVVFTGYRSNIHEKIDILRGFDVFVLPSSIEGLSLSLLEAMSCAVAPIVTDVGGNANVARGCGIIVNPTDIRNGVREALRHLKGDSRWVKSIGEEARRKVRDHYSWETNCTRLEEIYDKVIRLHFSPRN